MSPEQARGVQLSQRMKAHSETIDTPRGLVVTLPDRDFRGVSLDSAIAARIVNLASAIAGQSGLRIEVDGHGDQWSGERAEAVRSSAWWDKAWKYGDPGLRYNSSVGFTGPRAGANRTVA